MFDFGALPPEVNSGRMYVGAGSGPMLAAAAAWDDLAAELQSTAASYGSAIESLTAGPWTGPSSIAMAAAAAPYVAWLGATGAQAEEAAGQAKVAAGAYETAFAATVPPPVIAANRALLMGLVATNFLGQNTPAIAATEAHYLEMWAQDAAAMYAYAASSATASQLMPFDEPPQTTNVAAAPTQAAAVSQAGGASGLNIGTQLSQLVNSLPTALQSLGSGLLNSPTSSGNLLAGLQLPQLANLPSLANWPAGLGTGLSNWNTIWGALTGTYSLQGWTAIPGGPFLSFGQAYAWGQNGQGAAALLAGPKAISGTLAPLTQGAVTPVLSSAAGAPAAGAMGKAALVGGMSVPQGWTEAAPAIRTLAQVLPASAAAAPAASLAGEGGVFGQMALSSLAGRAVGAAFQSGGSGGAAASSLGGAVGTEAAAATIIVIPALED